MTLADGREYTARIVGRDPQTDVAVIKIDAKDLPAITFASSNKVEVGDRVLAVGNPFGIGETVTTGIVSAKERQAGLGLAYEDFIQTDAAINPGNSGGRWSTSKAAWSASIPPSSAGAADFRGSGSRFRPTSSATSSIISWRTARSFAATWGSEYKT